MEARETKNLNERGQEQEHVPSIVNYERILGRAVLEGEITCEEALLALERFDEAF